MWLADLLRTSPEGWAAKIQTMSNEELRARGRSWSIWINRARADRRAGTHIRL